MVGGALSRGLAVLDALVGAQNGVSLHRVAEITELPKTAAHRILGNLVQDGFVRQEKSTGDYVLTLRLVSMALRHLAENTVVDLARPVLDRLADVSGELVRLSLVDDGELIWVAKAQGARPGLRYDPDSGVSASLSASSSGIAWLSQVHRRARPGTDAAAGSSRPGPVRPERADHHRGLPGPAAPRAPRRLRHRRSDLRGRAWPASRRRSPGGPGARWSGCSASPGPASG